jgi:RNA polymerase sigma factor (sigma-70 family)
MPIAAYRQLERMTVSKERSIKALVAGCKEGRGQDWTELIERLSPVIFSICYRFRLSREESYDVFGKVSLTVLENLHSVRDEGRIFGYVSAITRHEASAVITKSRLNWESLREFYAHNESWQEESTGGGERTDEELQIMARAYSTLSSKCQQLLRLLFLEPEGVSYRDISRKMNIPISSIGPTRARCLEKLRHNMLKEGYEK